MKLNLSLSGLIVAGGTTICSLVGMFVSAVYKMHKDGNQGLPTHDGVIANEMRDFQYEHNTGMIEELKNGAIYGAAIGAATSVTTTLFWYSVVRCRRNNQANDDEIQLSNDEEKGLSSPGKDKKTP